MKTSTKLLIIFFSCIPLSLLAYNLLLKNEFDKKTFIREYRQDALNTFVKQNLPAFKHVVVAGIDGTVDRGFKTYWCPRVSVGNIGNLPVAIQHTGNYINIIEQYRHNVNFKVKNDTLFMSFVAIVNDVDITNTSGLQDELVQINAGNIESINAVSTYMTISNNVSPSGSLALSIAGHGHYDINNLSIDKLNITANDSSSVNIWKNNRIKNLNYSLLGSGMLNLFEHPVQKFNAIKVDSLAVIQSNDKANNFNK
ncbi:GIN domain-containing protein [Mucilaginibacter flavus]|uniref:GIN domain-containing protein n=1 Tax=Mucilaginibacter flavus TaxID=931504 RepID=UPI0025B5504D|nr:DUF2807 domain-containing protein [Mucilaginibacter flavus]MDN3585032.1 DUF2807 domain-containing protein [Mucilaginibacter flavus]